MTSPHQHPRKRIRETWNRAEGTCCIDADLAQRVLTAQGPGGGGGSRQRLAGNTSRAHRTGVWGGFPALLYTARPRTATARLTEAIAPQNGAGWTGAGCPAAPQREQRCWPPEPLRRADELAGPPSGQRGGRRRRRRQASWWPSGLLPSFPDRKATPGAGQMQGGQRSRLPWPSTLLALLRAALMQQHRW